MRLINQQDVEFRGLDSHKNSLDYIDITLGIQHIQVFICSIKTKVQYKDLSKRVQVQQASTLLAHVHYLRYLRI